MNAIKISSLEIEQKAQLVASKRNKRAISWRGGYVVKNADERGYENRHQPFDLLRHTSRAPDGGDRDRDSARDIWRNKSKG